MRYNATNPDRIADKARECRFFLVQMAEHEQRMDIEKFLYCLSAFLSAFRTTIYRSFGVAETRKGKAAARKFRDDLYKNPDIQFLKDTTDLEVHGDGAKVWQQYRVSLTGPIPGRWGRSGDRWGDPKNEGRLSSRYSSTAGMTQVLREPAGWRFDGHPKNLVELCHDALEAVEAAVGTIL